MSSEIFDHFDSVPIKVQDSSDSDGAYVASDSADNDSDDRGRPKEARSLSTISKTRASTSRRGSVSSTHIAAHAKTSSHVVPDTTNPSNDVAGGKTDDSPVVTDDDSATGQAGPCKKRKANEISQQELRSKHAKLHYSEGYRAILNSAIQDIASGDVQDIVPALQSSQLGSVWWTATEKGSFFHSLSKVGRDNVKEIAAAIGTKTAFEVQAYIHLLQHGLVEKQKTEPRQQLFGLDDIPSAIEISPECEATLDDAAKAISTLQDQYERRAEEDMWGETWLLTPEVDRWIESRRHEPMGDEKVEKILPAAQLLKLPNWLELSTRVFMNQGDGRDCWQDVAGPDEWPSIRATAFQDFHTLAVSLTRRLITTTMFCAMSRIRTQKTKPAPGRLGDVRRDDVESAIHVLGLDLDSNEFWIGSARRCHLKVHAEAAASTDHGEVLSYDDVERLLRRKGKLSDELRDVGRTDSVAVMSDGRSSYGGEPAAVPRSATQPRQSMEQDTDVGLASDYATSVGTAYNGPIKPSDSEFEDVDNRRERRRQISNSRNDLEDAQDEYIEAFDTHASRLEEQRLWDAVNTKPPNHVKLEVPPIPERPLMTRKDEDDLVDWRDHTEYWSQWETMETPLMKHEFADNRRLREMSSDISESDGTLSVPRSRVDGVDASSRDGSDADSDADEDIRDEVNNSKGYMEEGDAKDDVGEDDEQAWNEKRLVDTESDYISEVDDDVLSRTSVADMAEGDGDVVMHSDAE